MRPQEFLATAQVGRGYALGHFQNNGVFVPFFDYSSSGNLFQGYPALLLAWLRIGLQGGGRVFPGLFSTNGSPLLQFVFFPQTDSLLLGEKHLLHLQVNAENLEEGFDIRN